MPANDKRILLTCLALFVTVVAAYSPSFFADFYNEDFQYLSYLGQLDLPAGLGRSFVHNELDMAHVRFYRPLTSASLAVDLRLFDLASAPYLLINLGLHLLTAAAVLLLLIALTGSRLAAWTGAVAFAANPFSINAAGFIAARSNLLVGFFLTLLALVHLRARRDGGRSWMWASLLIAVLALLSYEAAVVLPGIVFLVDLLGSREEAPWRSKLVGAIRRTLPFAGLLILYFLVRHLVLGVFIGAYPGRVSAVPDPLDQVTRIGRALLELTSPWSLGLTAESRTEASLGWIAFLGLGALVLLWRRRDLLGPLAVGLGWAFVTAVPLYQVPDLLPLAGRRWYPVTIGIGLLIGVTLAGSTMRKGRSKATAVAWVAALVIAGCHLGELYRHADLIRLHSERQRHVREQLIAFHEDGDSDEPIFVVFRSAFGAKYVNEEFQLLLTEALSPPFTRVPVPVFPVNQREGLTRTELEALPGRVVHVDTDGTLREGPPPETPAGEALGGLRLLPTLLAQRPLPLTFVQDLALPLSPAGAPRLRLTLLTQASTARVEVRPTARLPFQDPATGATYELVRGMSSTLIRDCVRPVLARTPWPFFVYAESLDREGKVLARSSPVRIEVIRSAD